MADHLPRRALRAPQISTAVPVNEPGTSDPQDPTLTCPAPANVRATPPTNLQPVPRRGGVLRPCSRPACTKPSFSPGGAVRFPATTTTVRALNASSDRQHEHHIQHLRRDGEPRRQSDQAPRVLKGRRSSPATAPIPARLTPCCGHPTPEVESVVQSELTAAAINAFTCNGGTAACRSTANLQNAVAQEHHHDDTTRRSRRVR